MSDFSYDKPTHVKSNSAIIAYFFALV